MDILSTTCGEQSRTMDSQNLQRKFLETIKNQISHANYRAWFAQTKIESQVNGKIIFSTPSAFIKETLKARHLQLIQEVMEKLLSKKVHVEFVVNNPKSGEEIKEDIFQPTLVQTNSYLNPKYTLENFVVGQSNNVAYAAAQAVVINPGLSYNPLFIYGGTGVGKTHLMLGIGNTILRKKPHLKVNYSSSEKFTNDYVEAIQNRKMGDLRKKYRSAGILLIDDIQFFSGRDGTQEEFFHTFNELQAKNSQIVITSDRPPVEIYKLADRLKSRFQGGLMVDIQLPDFDTRVAILRAKCQERGVVLPEDSLKLIAAYAATNARELEGKLIQILQVIKAKNIPPTEDTLKSILGQKPQAFLSSLHYKQVFALICQYFAVKEKDLTGPRRQQELVLPRHLCMYILSEDLQMPVEKIGEVLGGRDHTTVMHGRDKIKKLVTTDREVQRMLIEIKNKLTTTT